MGHYLFLLATAKFPVDTERLTGMKQQVTIGTIGASAEGEPLPAAPESTTWRFSDGKIGWRIKRKKR